MSAPPGLLRCKLADGHETAHKAGATPEEIYEVINPVGGRAGGAARQNSMEAWRLVFRPDLPTIFRVSELGELT